MKIWEKNLAKLKRFKQKYHHTNVPLNWRPDRVLAQWIENIRISKKRLPAELLKELKKLDFNFEFKKNNTWDTMYGQLASFWEKHGHTQIPRGDQYEELASWLENQWNAKSRLSNKQLALLNQLGWETSLRKRNSWEFMYQELKKFKQKYGHTKVLVTDKEHYQLATWVHNIRARSNRLTDDQRKKLDALGFLWQKDLKKLIENKWLTRYTELKEFKKQFGHCNVPISWKQNRKLALWVSEQRLREKNTGLLPERKKLLNKIGFSWSEDLIRQFDAHWNQMLKRLREYKARHGHMRVSKKDYDLKMWAMSQRTMKRLGMLPVEKQKKLDGIGFIWKDVHRNLWEEMYNRLRQYKIKHGTTHVPQRTEQASLAAWVGAQRRNYSQGKLSEERIKKLNKIGFIWKVGFLRDNEMLKKAWKNKHDQLVAYKKKFNTNQVPGNGPYKKLSRWVSKQRLKRKAGKISETEYRLLNGLGFDWNNSTEFRWEKMFEALFSFKRKFRSLKVSEKTHKSLFRWISKQKQKHKIGKLTKDKIGRLKELGLNLNLRWQVKKEGPKF